MIEIFIPFFVIVIIVLLIILPLSFFTVAQQTKAIIETFGKFTGVANPGLNMKIPFIQRIVGRVNLRVQQLDVDIETKTKDNVFVHVVVSVQYFVLEDKVYEAFYKLENATSQITSFVFDVVRAEVPSIVLDDVFEKKDDIAIAVKKELSEVMNDFGYGIIKALVTDIEPDEKVKIAMNEINASSRMRVAATEKGEAEKIITVKHAEAEAESKALQGQGISRQRQAIVDGLRQSVSDFQQSVDGVSAGEVMNLVLMTQYFDTLKELGNASNSNTILIPHSPGSLSDLTSQIRDAVITANEVNKK